MKLRSCSVVILPTLAVLAACGDSLAPEHRPAGPAVVGQTDDFADAPLTPIHATATELLFVFDGNSINQTGLYRMQLEGGAPELIAPGLVRGSRITEDAIHVIVSNGRVVELEVPFDGSAPTETALIDADAVAVFVVPDATIIFSFSTRTRRITRIPAAGGEPVLLDEDTQSRPPVGGPFLDDGFLYWLEDDRVLWRLETVSGATAEPVNWSLPPIDFRDGVGIWDELELHGVADGQLMLSYARTTLKVTGELSNGDPDGYEIFAGGALFTNDLASGGEEILSERVTTAKRFNDRLLANLEDGRTLEFDALMGDQVDIGDVTTHLPRYEKAIVFGETVYYSLAIREDDRRIHSIRAEPLLVPISEL